MWVTTAKPSAAARAWLPDGTHSPLEQCPAATREHNTKHNTLIQDAAAHSDKIHIDISRATSEDSSETKIEQQGEKYWLCTVQGAGGGTQFRKSSFKNTDLVSQIFKQVFLKGVSRN